MKFDFIRVAGIILWMVIGFSMGMTIWEQKPDQPAPARIESLPTQAPDNSWIYEWEATQAQFLDGATGQYDEIDPNAYNRDFQVCDPQVAVRGAPGESFPVLYVLRYGSDVGVREWSHGTQGWAMIGRAEWIWGGSICRLHVQ